MACASDEVEKGSSGISLTPPVKGSWKWQKDNKLLFEPSEDWPVGQAVTVKLQKKGLVADLVVLTRYELKFRTALL